jgi:hypothetical protein
VARTLQRRRLQKRWLDRRWLGLVVAQLLLAGSPGCGRFDLSLPEGFVDEAAFRARQLDYLLYATQVVDPGSPLNAIAHMEREARDPSYTAPVGAVGPDDWDPIFDMLANLEDTSDFQVLYLLNAYYGYRGHPMVHPDTWAKTEQAFLGFKYWYRHQQDPAVQDDMWYWSENHLAIFAADEYLAGQLFPDREFDVRGTDGEVLTGADHMAQARQRLLDWFELRMRFGFSEWHSNVYLKHDLNPLLALVEWADDPEIRDKAAMVLDVVIADLAIHTFKGVYGATHGRSYKKDKMTARDEPSYDVVKLLFDTAELGYRSHGDSSATPMARAARYRPPAVLLEIARSTEPLLDRERMGIAFDEFETPGADPPVHPYGFSYTDIEAVPIWWSMGNLTSWQTLPLTIQVIDSYDLWSTTNFQPFALLEDFVNDVGIGVVQTVAWQLAHAASFGLLKEVNTQTYRTADYMLSSAQSYRPGSRMQQIHGWQATLDADAIVFTTHPGTEPAQTTDWRVDDDTGFWTGTASNPRSAQHRSAAIFIYSPQYVPVAAPLDVLSSYRPYTHAYFPQEQFDEVVQDGHWTFGRKGSGYVALFSWRDTQWQAYDPALVATRGMSEPFDLRAPGGPQNVWIVECGSQSEWGSFADFRAAILAADLTVTPLEGAALPEGVSNGPVFDVVYHSPSQGVMEFGWEGPLRVDGEVVPIDGYPRMENRFGSTPFDHQTTFLYDPDSRTGLLHSYPAGARVAYTLP